MASSHLRSIGVMTGHTVTGERHDDAGSGDACLFAAPYLPPVDARRSARWMERLAV